MKWNSKKPELVRFNDDVYLERVKNMSADALWLRECLKYRTKVSSGTGVAFSSIMFLPTFGASTFGLWVSGRTLDVARRKEKIIEQEVKRRNLPHYERKLRDTLIPLGISIAVITTIGVIDVLCMTGTSASVLASVAPHGMDALNALMHHPHDFLAAVWQGIEFQGQQFL